MIAVTGALGKTGRAIIRKLASQGLPVRGLVQSHQQASDVIEAGAAEAMQIDLLEPSSLVPAFAGVRALYHICPNVHPGEVEIGKNAISTAQQAGVERFVLHSVLHPLTQAMPHHWNKLLVEEQLINSGLGFTILQPASYMQNVLGEMWRVRLRSQYHIPYSVEARFSPVDLLDVAEAAAIVLTMPDHDGAIYELAGPEIHTPKTMAHEMGAAFGKMVTAVQVDLEEWRKGKDLDEPRTELLIKMFEYYEKHGLWGNSRVLADLLGRAPTRLREFLFRIVQEGATA
jgi:uncharacterized protein YbjT (DUF2867 family)